MKQAENNATEGQPAWPPGRAFDLCGVVFTVAPGQSVGALVTAEGCLIDAVISILKPGRLPIGEIADERQVCAAYVILELLSAVNTEAQTAEG